MFTSREHTNKIKRQILQVSQQILNCHKIWAKSTVFVKRIIHDSLAWAGFSYQLMQNQLLHWCYSFTLFPLNTSPVGAHHLLQSGASSSEELSVCDPDLFWKVLKSEHGLWMALCKLKSDETSILRLRDHRLSYFFFVGFFSLMA